MTIVSHTRSATFDEIVAENDRRGEVIDRLQAELAAALRAASPQWRPISEAPKDGTVVMLYWPTMSITAYPAIGVHHGDEYGWDMPNRRDYGEVFPTHWMPLPSPPTALPSPPETP